MAVQLNPNDSSLCILRKIIGWSGVVLPLTCLFYSAGAHLTYRTSISAYYYSPVNFVFVGILCMLGGALCSYKGYTRAEGSLGIVAGICAFLVAACPTKDGINPSTNVKDCDYLRILIGQSAQWKHHVHGPAAIILFLCFFIFSGVFFVRTSGESHGGWSATRISLRQLFFMSPETPGLLPMKIKRNAVYRWCARIIFLSMVGIAALQEVIPYSLITGECIMLFAFALSWLTKAEYILQDIKPMA